VSDRNLDQQTPCVLDAASDGLRYDAADDSTERST
jgi:hypothetical protein